MAESMTDLTILTPLEFSIFPPAATRGRHPTPETIQPIKGKPETGIYAAVICPPPTIRFPHAAPFESCLSGFRSPLEFSIFPPAATWGRHPPPEIMSLPILNTPYSILSYATFAQAAGRSAPLHYLSLVLRASEPLVCIRPCPRVTVPTCPLSPTISPACRKARPSPS